MGLPPRIVPCSSRPGHLISTYPRWLPRRLVLDSMYCMLVHIWPLCHFLTYNKVDYSLGNVPRRLFLQESLSIHVARVMITRISPQSTSEIQHTFKSHLKPLFCTIKFSYYGPGSVCSHGSVTLGTVLSCTGLTGARARGTGHHIFPMTP